MTPRLVFHAFLLSLAATLDVCVAAEPSRAAMESVGSAQSRDATSGSRDTGVRPSSAFFPAPESSSVETPESPVLFPADGTATASPAATSRWTPTRKGVRSETPRQPGARGSLIQASAQPAAPGVPDPNVPPAPAGGGSLPMDSVQGPSGFSSPMGVPMPGEPAPAATPMTPVEEVFTPDGTFGGEVCPTECCSDWCKRCWWFGLRSTCDMPSHFPYPPAFHGYYYFQPYNYTHVLQHQQMAPLLGAEPFAPYEATNLQKIYVDVLGEEEAARPAGDGRLKSLTPDAGKLPLLEELLEGRHDLDSPRGRPGKVAPPKPGVEGKTAPPKKSGGKKSEPLPRTKGPFDE